MDDVDKRESKKKVSKKTPIDLTDAKYYFYECYISEDGPKINLGDCDYLQNNLTISAETIVVKRGELIYRGYDTCSIMLAVQDYAKHSYSINSKSLGEVIKRLSNGCLVRKPQFFGGITVFDVDENLAFYKNDPNRTDLAPVQTVVRNVLEKGDAGKKGNGIVKSKGKLKGKGKGEGKEEGEGKEI
ncbi:expressed protein [Phakopsora pachyrhizi]|uniref:Expressed protein n=1 Tax=Phakopsora pachyrhizi TaxID=170000 RepID=A0AAV0B6B6_PHAPC|nr:expressed protein [Phakopsora pachyrhizi]